MQQKTFVSILSVLQLVTPVPACDFHSENGKTPINNQRRSLPGEHLRTAIENVRVFDGWRFGLPQTLCLDGGYIVGMNGCQEPANSVNGTGKFIVPGLIDSHIHLTDVQSVENFTSYGCTTAMYMHCRNTTQCDTIANLPGLASVRRAGRSSVGAGSPHSRTDPARPRDTLIYPDTNVTQFTQWQFNNGSDFHKITAEVNGPSTQQQIEMVRVAHTQYQKQTMTHASSIMTYGQAVESLTDGIQHVPDDGILDDATIQRIKSQTQFVTPTLNVFRFGFQDLALRQYFAVQEGGNRTLENAETNARLLYEAGVSIIVGTDAVGPMTTNGTVVTVPFGLTVHYEMDNFVNIVGMSPAEVINAATCDAARWHRVNDRGTVEVGKRADLLMLNSNPLLNITNTRDIDRVWAFGIEVSQVSRLGT